MIFIDLYCLLSGRRPFCGVVHRRSIQPNCFGAVKKSSCLFAFVWFFLWGGVGALQRGPRGPGPLGAHESCFQSNFKVLSFSNKYKKWKSSRNRSPCDIFEIRSKFWDCFDHTRHVPDVRIYEFRNHLTFFKFCSWLFQFVFVHLFGPLGTDVTTSLVAAFWCI